MSLCLIVDNNGLFRNYPYIGEYSAADSCIMIKPTDEFICLDKFLKQKGEF